MLFLRQDGFLLGVLQGQSISGTFPSRFSSCCLTSPPLAASIGFAFLGVCRLLGREEWDEELVLRDDRRRGEVPMGECPRRLTNILPGRPQGSCNLPWDSCSIAAKKAWPPEAGGWAGGIAFARGVGGSFRPGSGTNGIAKIPSVSGWCIAGKQRSGNESVGRRRRGARTTRKRSVPGGSGGRARMAPLRTATWR